MTNYRKILFWGVLGITLFIMVGCDPVDIQNTEDNTFQNAVRLAGHSFDILGDNSGINVVASWAVTDVLASENLVTYAVVFSEVDETAPVMQDAIAVALPAIGDEVRVTYNLIVDTAILPQGTYTVNLGWYYDIDPVQYLTTNYGTADQEQYLRLFDFSVDDAGNISPTAFTIDSSDS